MPGGHSFLRIAPILLMAWWARQVTVFHLSTARPSRQGCAYRRFFRAIGLAKHAQHPARTVIPWLPGTRFGVPQARPGMQGEAQKMHKYAIRLDLFPLCLILSSMFHSARSSLRSSVMHPGREPVHAPPRHAAPSSFLLSQNRKGPPLAHPGGLPGAAAAVFYRFGISD